MGVESAVSAVLVTWSGLCVGASLARYRQTIRPTTPIRTSSGRPFVHGFEGANRCDVCGGSGKTMCGSCAGAGRLNFPGEAVLPRGEWPQWCPGCRGSGRWYCPRCCGTGMQREPIGFQLPTDN